MLAILAQKIGPHREFYIQDWLGRQCMLLRTEKNKKEHGGDTHIPSALELEYNRKRLQLLEPNSLEEEPCRTDDRTSEWYDEASSGLGQMAESWKLEISVAARLLMPFGLNFSAYYWQNLAGSQLNK